MVVRRWWEGEQEERVEKGESFREMCRGESGGLTVTHLRLEGALPMVAGGVWCGWGG